MATYRRRNTTTYSTYGSVAYAPVYEGNTVRTPRREEELRRAPAPRPKQREQVHRHVRARVEVRPVGAVAAGIPATTAMIASTSLSATMALPQLSAPFSIPARKSCTKVS